jgi:putative FmdB family regulatory protein
MPIYEYISEQDGAVIELVRPMADADKPVTDPEGKGRSFKRQISSFAAKGTGTSSGGSASSLPIGGCCPCGKNSDSCSRA